MFSSSKFWTCLQNLHPGAKAAHRRPLPCPPSLIVGKGRHHAQFLLVLPERHVTDFVKCLAFAEKPGGGAGRWKKRQLRWAGLGSL